MITLAIHTNGLEEYHLADHGKYKSIADLSTGDQRLYLSSSQAEHDFDDLKTGRKTPAQIFGEEVAIPAIIMRPYLETAAIMLEIEPKALPFTLVSRLDRVNALLLTVGTKLESRNVIATIIANWEAETSLYVGHEAQLS